MVVSCETRGTPPHAVVFGSCFIRIAEMGRAGFWLNWVGVALISVLAYAAVIPVLGR